MDPIAHQAPAATSPFCLPGWVACGSCCGTDGKRVEYKLAVGLVKDVDPAEADDSRKVDRQKLRETINNCGPLRDDHENVSEIVGWRILGLCR